MQSRPVFAALLLAALCSSCVFAYDTNDRDKKKAVAEQSAPAAAGAAVAAEASSPEAAKKAELKALKKEREKTYANLELALAEMDAERELLSAQQELERAQNSLQAAQRDLEHFQKVERPLEMEDLQMDLDRSTQSAHERQMELDEIMAMYKKDDFAKLTKELVVQREKFRMEMAQRELALAKKKANDKQQHAWAVKELDLSLALKKAQDGVGDAQAKLKKTQARNELELMRARHKVEDAQRPDEDAEGPAGAKGA